MDQRVSSVNVSRAKPLVAGDRTVLSGIGKRAVEGAVKVLATGLAGDEQADLNVHGGLSKAVYAYPHEHYPHWQTMRSQAGALAWGAPQPYGSMGENLSLAGLLESEVWIGDLLRFPDCELAVSEPRVPCFKFNAAMGFDQAAKMMLQSGWCGFYLAVRVPGTIRAGETFRVLPGPRDIGIPEQFRSITGQHRRRS